MWVVAFFSTATLLILKPDIVKIVYGALTNLSEMKRKMITTRDVIIGIKNNFSTQIVKDYVSFKMKAYLINHLDIGKVESVGKTGYRVSYFYDVGDHQYTIHFPKHRGARKITGVKDLEGDADITEIIYKAMGPSHNFHGIPTTPALLGYPKGIIVTYRCGKEITYFKNEIISTSAI